MPRKKTTPSTTSSSKADQATAYAKDVVAGEVLVGRLVRLACERHLRDLAEGQARGLRWDPEAAARAIKFFGLLRLPMDGAIDGQPFTLAPFQCFIVGSLTGWKGADGHRRFRTAYIEQGKGSGKTPMAAGLGLYGLIADSEAAAEIYSGATTAFQAGILFRDAKRMVESSPALRSRLEVGLNNIAFLETDSFFRPVSSEHKQLSGPRPHMALIDEIHEHPNDLVVNKLRAGTKGRRQALIFEITNSGYDRNSVCWYHHEYSQRVLEGHADDSWFAYVCTLDPCEKCRGEGAQQPKDGCPDCDDWRDPKVWPKVNPNLGVSIQAKYLEEQVREAVGMPSKENIVKRLNFCIWTESATRAIPMEKWDGCGSKDPKWWREAAIERLSRCPCYGGLDLGSTADLTALALLFRECDEDGKERFTVLPYYWVPIESARKREQKDRVPYETWIRLGFVIGTEGDATDYDRVRRDMNELATQFSIGELAVDRLFQGAQLCTQLAGDGFNVIAFGQGFLSMAAPVKRFLELVASGGLNHGGHPVLRWNASNAATEQDPAGCLKWSKRKSNERIDGVVAATMGLARAMADEGGGGRAMSVWSPED